MRSQTRHQEYKYQYKNLAVNNSNFCTSGPTLSMSVPDNLLDIKAIYMHAVLRFDSSTPSAKRKILYAGGRYAVDSKGNPVPSTGNLRQVNLSADPTTRIADLKLDITNLKDGILSAVDTTSDQPAIDLNLLTDISGGFDVTGSVILWKIDIVYTTTGIQ